MTTPDWYQADDDDSDRYVLGPDMRAGEQWADAALVLTITEQEAVA